MIGAGGVTSYGARVLERYCFSSMSLPVSICLLRLRHDICIPKPGIIRTVIATYLLPALKTEIERNMQLAQTQRDRQIQMQ